MRECALLLISVSLWTGYQADVGPLSMQWMGQQQEQWKIIF